MLVDELSWRWVFWIGVPVIALGYLWTARATRETRDETAGRNIDVPGVAALTVGLGAIVLALVQADDWGWGSARTIAVLAVGVAASVAFVVIDEHVRTPVVEFALFRNKPYLGASAAAFGWCSRGTTSTWVGACALMSRNATVRSVVCTTSPGISPATILQNKQSSTCDLLRRSSHAGIDRAAAMVR